MKENDILIVGPNIMTHRTDKEPNDNRLKIKLSDALVDYQKSQQKQSELSWFRNVLHYCYNFFSNIFKKPFASTANETIDTLLTEEERMKIADMRIERLTKMNTRHNIKPKIKVDNIESDVLTKKYDQIVRDWCE
jgi:hypothetical protein